MCRLTIFRVLLLAVPMVLVFERIIPPGHEPAVLRAANLRPILSAAGRQGLRKLPPGVDAFIDRVKNQHGLYGQALGAAQFALCNQSPSGYVGTWNP